MKKPVKIGLAVVGGLIIIGAIAGAGGDSSNTNSSGSSNGGSSSATKEYRFAERADKQTKDVEVLPGEVADVDGVKLTLSGVEYKTALGEYTTAESGKTYVVATVSLENTSDRTKAYNPFDFRVQTASGQVLDGTFASVDNMLSSGDIITGGKVSGQIVFEVPVEDGHQYIIWKPSAWGSGRAVVQVK